MSNVRDDKNGTDDTIVDCMKVNGNIDIQIIDCISGMNAICGRLDNLSKSK